MKAIRIDERKQNMSMGTQLGLEPCPVCGCLPVAKRWKFVMNNRACELTAKVYLHCPCNNLVTRWCWDRDSPRSSDAALLKAREAWERGEFIGMKRKGGRA